MSEFWADRAWLGGADLADGVTIEVADGVISRVVPDSPPSPDAERLGGVTIPGMANAHSHVFHRALRSRTQHGQGSFWTWRDGMYELADRLDPDGYRSIATAVFGEMLLAGITLVGEFHYIHHQPDGTPYDDPNEMGRAIVAAASDAGIRLTLLDTCYLQGGLHADGHDPIRPEQRRFGDRTVAGYLERVSRLTATEARIGSAIHSVRAVAPGDMEQIGYSTGGPLHIHLSERPEENEQCLAAFGRSPTQLVADAGLLGERLTAVHGTHLTPHDIDLLGRSGSGVCLCPTTERDLADGIGPASELRRAGASLSLGTDSHAMIDMFEEARAMELNERLASRVRGNQAPVDLLDAATREGYRALGWPEGGRIVPGAPADLVAVTTDSTRMAGSTSVESLVFAAGAADVTDVVVGGRRVVGEGAHLSLDVAGELRSAITAVLG